MKRIIAIILLAIMAFGLCGCGASEKSAASPATEAPVTNAEPVRQEKKMLGVLLCETDADTYEDISAYCDGTSLSLSDYEDYRTLCCEDWETAQNVLLCGEFTDCTDIIFVGSDACCALAEELWTENPDIAQRLYTFCLEAETVSFQITDCQYNFSNGRAWVKFKDNNNTLYVALIDEQGYAKYIQDKDCTVAFNDGLTVLDDGNNGLIFLDREGQIVTKLQTNDGTKSYKIQGYSDGVWLICKNVSSFSENGNYLFFMKADGTVFGNEYDLNELDPRNYRGLELSYTDIGGGLLYGRNQYGYSDASMLWIADTSDGTLNDIPPYRKKWNPEGHYLSEADMDLRLLATEQDKNGQIPFLIFDAGSSRSGLPFIVPIKMEKLREIAVSYDSDMLTEYLWENACALPENQYIANYLTIEDGVIGCNMNYGTYWANIYFDYSGNPLFQYPKFPDTVRIADSTVCSGDYIMLLLTGADSHYYVTVVNRDGTLKYSPLDINDYSEEPNRTINFSNGYIDLGNGNFVTPEGQVVQKDGFFGISENLKIVSLSEGVEPYFSGGYGFYREDYDPYILVDWHGNVIAEQIAITDETIYGSDAEPYFEEPEKDIVEEPQQTSTEHTYVKISNFQLTGKWKNIGSETFGQAQKGAIVAFDGTNCNFFSPMDTYAFSKDGDYYKLECTSLLATDTLTFTVKTVDKDHIDIFYGSKIIEMERVQ